eukprot:6156870-Lingulodinium_polyedra.AAC.1
MNLTASNAVSRPWAGDIPKLPYYAQWRAIQLGRNEALEWSFDDLKGCFYIFRLPEQWAPLF